MTERTMLRISLSRRYRKATLASSSIVWTSSQSTNDSSSGRSVLVEPDLSSHSMAPNARRRSTEEHQLYAEKTKHIDTRFCRAKIQSRSSSSNMPSYRFCELIYTKSNMRSAAASGSKLALGDTFLSKVASALNSADSAAHLSHCPLPPPSSTTYLLRLSLSWSSRLLHPLEPVTLSGTAQPSYLMRRQVLTMEICK
jgi:hypothetical protein